MSLSSSVKNLAENRTLREKVCSWFLQKYSDDTSNLFLHAGAIGWILSSLAQTVAIAVNNKIDSNKKRFLVPQEIADGIANVGLFYTLTSSITALAKKLMNMKKIKFDESDAVEKILNISKGTNLQELMIPAKNLNDEQLKLATKYHGKIVGMAVFVSLSVQIIACNILTPILRNKYASHRQQKFLMEQRENFIHNPELSRSYQSRVDMKTFLNSYPKYPMKASMRI